MRRWNWSHPTPSRGSTTISTSLISKHYGTVERNDCPKASGHSCSSVTMITARSSTVLGTSRRKNHHIWNRLRAIKDTISISILCATRRRSHSNFPITPSQRRLLHRLESTIFSPLSSQPRLPFFHHQPPSSHPSRNHLESLSQSDHPLFRSSNRPLKPRMYKDKLSESEILSDRRSGEVERRLRSVIWMT